MVEDGVVEKGVEGGNNVWSLAKPLTEVTCARPRKKSRTKCMYNKTDQVTTEDSPDPSAIQDIVYFRSNPIVSEASLRLRWR